MNAFRTIVKPATPPYLLGYGDTMVSIGSCFSEHIGRYFERYKFTIDINPFGQQYNPFSIARAMRRLADPQPYAASELMHHNELFHSFDHNGSFSAATERETLAEINDRLARASRTLRAAKVLFLTFGTAYVFKWKETGQIVSNCHKMPGGLFDMELMSTDAIAAEIGEAIKALRKINADIKVVYTVSPVRYFAFGHFENSVSKGNLHAAIHSLLGHDPSSYYFPAYELVVDDLRDYRFYAEDMIHPSAPAIKYVWDVLRETLISPVAKELMREVEEINAAADHRPRNPDTDAHRKFVANTLQRIEKLEKAHQFDFAAQRRKLIPIG
jgi:hypothetical protein